MDLIGKSNKSHKNVSFSIIILTTAIQNLYVINISGHTQKRTSKYIFSLVGLYICMLSTCHVTTKSPRSIFPSEITRLFCQVFFFFYPVISPAPSLQERYFCFVLLYYFNEPTKPFHKDSVGLPTQATQPKAVWVSPTFSQPFHPRSYQTLATKVHVTHWSAWFSEVLLEPRFNMDEPTNINCGNI